jgi:hypothetical protein
MAGVDVRRPSRIARAGGAGRRCVGSRRQGGLGMRGVGKPDEAFRRWLAAEKNLSSLTDLAAQWIDPVHGRRPQKGVALDRDSRVSPTQGGQETSVWNGRYGAPAITRCLCVRPVGRSGALRPVIGQRPKRRWLAERACRSWCGVGAKSSRLYCRAGTGFLLRSRQTLLGAPSLS